ncbi:hypothetical protein WA026_023289 [Henosepilachna vigintioctopunctata]|uniref:Transcription initiation protein SPT3 homolog n=1 Tax=Henosepilachna vigintioctopunctata TaxID=420089 RepID=A0AAW1TTF6_9CUCU
MEQTKQKVSFTNEISRMMFGFGDSHAPNPDTVQLVEHITLLQLRTIIQEALKYSTDGATLKGEELVFLMRRDKHKMRRFVKYLQNKKFKGTNPHQIGGMNFDPEEKPKCYLMQFIEKIDETGEFIDLSEVDEVKLEREIRADRMSQVLNEEQYIEFSKARCASFCSKQITMSNLERLKIWIDPIGKITYRLEALEVLAYLAYQTVAEITDYALLVRMDAKYHDPLQHFNNSYYTATMFNSGHKFGAINIDHSRVYTGQDPISIDEIKEVLRRIRSPQGGVLSLGGKLPETHFCFAL